MKAVIASATSLFPYLNDGKRNGGTVLIDISNLETKVYS